MRHPEERDPGPTRADAEHPDEGTIHAWLDGALPAAEAAALERHVAACSACAAAVAEARGLVAAASRILGALDEVPAGVVPAAAPAAPAVEPRPVVADPAVTPIAAGRAARRSRRSWTGWPARAAAAVALLAVGTWTVVERGGGTEELARVGADAAALDASERAAPRGPAAPEAAASTASPDTAAVTEPSRAMGGAAGTVAGRGASGRPVDLAAGAPAEAPAADTAAPPLARTSPPPARRVGALPSPLVVRSAPPAVKVAADSPATADARAFAAGTAAVAGASVAERRAEPVAATGAPAAQQAASPPAAPAPPPPPPPAPVAAPPPPTPVVVAPEPARRQASARAAPSGAGANVLADRDARPAGCWRVALDAAPADSAARQVERALRGWIRLAPGPATGDWRPAVPVTEGARAEAAERAPSAGAARWRERPGGEIEVEWPAAAGPLRLLLRPAGDAMTGTATPAGGAPVRVTLRAGSCGAG